MRWIRFAERFPRREDGNELLCTLAGGRPFVYHWFIDSAGFTELGTFYWLEGVKFPPVPKPGESAQNGHSRGAH